MHHILLIIPLKVKIYRIMGDSAFFAVDCRRCQNRNINKLIKPIDIIGK